MSQPVFRFAPSPNGELHLGHAYSALLNQKLARESGGKLLLRIEDIDIQRCTPQLEKQMLEDLEWIGFEWDEEPRRQSQNMNDYRHALKTLQSAGLLFASNLSRQEIKNKIAAWQQKTGKSWPSDPDGAPLFPRGEDLENQAPMAALTPGNRDFSLRLNMQKAIGQLQKGLFWNETGTGLEGQSGTLQARPEQWGDVIIARKDVPTSYHLSCVVDDALQGVTTVVRGMDLFQATSIHRLLQELLGLPQPDYHHHPLILDEDGTKLSKSRKDTSLRQLRNQGFSPVQVREKIAIT